MKINGVLKGKYVVAVSGGVDSVALLDALCAQQPECRLIIAHADHGMRKDSDADARFVAALAQKYSVTFELAKLELGLDASEAKARLARYDFLHSVRDKHGADGIMTAHHADDVVETVVLNLLRGTGWRGLSSLRSSEELHRPLSKISKSAIYDYALARRLEWCEDVTNRDISYTIRNRIRHRSIPEARRKDPEFNTKILRLQERQAKVRSEIDALVPCILDACLDRGALLKEMFTVMNDWVATEVLKKYLAGRGIRQTRPQLDRIREFVRTAENGKRFPLGARQWLLMKSDRAVVVKG